MFYLAWGCAIAAPILALVASVVARRLRPDAWKTITLGAVGLISTVALATMVGGSFVFAEANILALCVVYFAYCFLAFSCLRIRQQLLRRITFLIASAPIALGYVLGTIGVMGLGFIVADATRPPTHVEAIGEGLICRVSSWGSAGTDSGYDVEAYQQFGFLERRVARLNVNFSSDASPVHCSDIEKLLR